jgi:hypothetical protein
MLSSGGSDSEKEEPQSVQPQAAKIDVPRTRNMLRKTGSKNNFTSNSFHLKTYF